MEVKEIAQYSRKAARQLAAVPGEKKAEALRAVSAALVEAQEEIFIANKNDIAVAEAEDLPLPLLKRLKFDEHKLRDVCAGLCDLAAMEDPVGKKLLETEIAKGMILQKVTCPIGVIGIIFESRPDALVQIAGLCLKSGNACLLKGGREAWQTNSVLSGIIRKTVIKYGIPADFAVLLKSREDVNEMLRCEQEIDLLIPRGSNQFVRYIMDNTKIPVMGHADGLCHTYVDKQFDIDMAMRIILDAKTQYVSACNSTETVLVHKDAAASFLPELVKTLKDNQVKIYGCERSRQIVPEIGAADQNSFYTEYLDYALSLKIVDDLTSAIDHINKYGSGHTDAIITNDAEAAEQFMELVDSADVFVNCSTRFADGYRFGFGAEVGISTSKIHARGPVGIDGLLSSKYRLIGSGQTVTDFAEGNCRYIHRRIV